MAPPPANSAAAKAPLGPAAHAPDLAACLREYLVKYRGDFDARVRRGDCGVVVGRAIARSMDGLMSALLPATQATLSPIRKWVDCTLAAVGSYGRGVLGPRSDLDVRIVVDGDVERAQAVSEALLYPLWDAGCQVGHQVIAVDDVLELARQDLSTATALLDLRVVAGPPARVAKLLGRAHQGFFTAELADFLGRLREERASRHERYGGSLYLLEPDVKSGAGALRDVEIARWAAKARWNVAELDDLVRIGVLLPRELDDLAAAQAFMTTLRAHLHVRADRRSDRLTFDAQEELGRALGEARPDEPDAVAAERLMQRYYGHARTITRFVDRILDLCTPQRSRSRHSLLMEQAIAVGVRTFDGHATLDVPANLNNDPALAMRLYHAASRKALPVYPYARDAVMRAAGDPDFAATLRSSPEGAKLFLDCLGNVADRAVPRPGGSILRELHDVGLLLAMIPEFDPVVGRVHHDIYHVYTVDVHSVAAVDRLRALARGDLATDHPLACRVAGDVARPTPLYVATLLHDVGKGGGGAGHSERGAQMSLPISARLGLSAEDAEEVRWLIQAHLDLYHVATRRDLEDPATIAEFAGTIRDSGGSPIERLRHLYLLTIADISTTSPTAMTSWKARMLDDLFLATTHHLASTDRGEETADTVLRRIRAEVVAAWPAGHDQAFLRAYVDGMPKSYLLAHGSDAIAAHARIVESRHGRASALGVAPTKDRDAFELCVVAADKPGLLASIAAALSANRLDVMTAHVYNRPLPGGDTEAVDLFRVRRAGRDGDEAIAPLTDRERARIADDLEAVAAGRVAPLGLLKERRGAAPSWREKPSPAVQTDVEIDDRASRRFTVIDVYAKDRPGLLFTIAYALHELKLTIARSKIATEGARAADSFYVTEIDGSKVDAKARRDEIKHAITEAIDRLAREGIAS